MKGIGVYINKGLVEGVAFKLETGGQGLMNELQQDLQMEVNGGGVAGIIFFVVIGTQFIRCINQVPEEFRFLESFQLSGAK